MSFKFAIIRRRIFLIMLGTSLFLARSEVYEKTTKNQVPSWERACTHHVYGEMNIHEM